jgi:hypothetical protein
MSPHTFSTPPGATGEQRKFINPTQGFVGANVYGPDGKPTAIAVEPGGEVWLTPEEERMTAEAPRLAQDNPFIKEWDEIVEYDGNGEPLRTVRRTGTLALADEPPRPVASDRFIPERGSADELRATREAMEGLSQPSAADRLAGIEVPEGWRAIVPDDPNDPVRFAPIEAESDRSPDGGEQTAETEPEPAPEVVGAPDIPEQPPVQGQPSPDEIVGTPEAKAANDEALASRESTDEQPTVTADADAESAAIPV